MAIKRFDDIDKKARELEAQAKKLRREKQAAKTRRTPMPSWRSSPK